MSSGRRVIAIVLLIGGVILIIVVLAALFFSGGGDDVDVVDQASEAAEAVGDAVGELQSTAVITGDGEIAGTPGAFVEVVVSLQTVPRGWRMTEAELTTDMRRSEDVGPNVITNVEDAVGLYARSDIFQGETLTEDALVGDPTLVGVEEYGPSSLIPGGTVAQAVPMDRLSSVAYALDAGDSVDIMMTFLVAEVDPQFQTLLENSAVFILENVGEEGDVARTFYLVDPFGRVESLPTGDLTMLAPSEVQRPAQVSIIIQNAKVIQVGPYFAEEEVVLPTPTPTPDPQATATPEAGTVPTPTPRPPDVLLVALAPQQQLLLKYAIESAADIDYALRAPNDSQIYGVEDVDLAYLLERFDIELPIDFDFTVEPIFVTATPRPDVTATPVP